MFFTALLAINGAFDRGARRGRTAASRERSAPPRARRRGERERRIRRRRMGRRRVGRRVGDASRDDDDGEVLVAEKRANRRVRILHAAAAAFDATPRGETPRGERLRASPSGSGSRVGDAVLEMTDLAKMVGEARGGRGRFKSRGGKSSRTPSPEPEVERRSSRESSPQRKARLAREKAAAAKTPRRGWTKASSPFSVASPAASRRRTVSVEVSPPRPTGGVGGIGDVRVPRRDRSTGTHARGGGGCRFDASGGGGEEEP